MLSTASNNNKNNFISITRELREYDSCKVDDIKVPKNLQSLLSRRITVIVQTAPVLEGLVATSIKLRLQEKNTRSFVRRARELGLPTPVNSNWTVVNDASLALPSSNINVHL